MRRLALARAGLLASKWTGLPTKARGAGPSARRAALDVINRFGYLQLDTISVVGARSHALVLLSRLEGMDAALGEQLLAPGAPLFEYWGHEACWLPLDLYPLMAFRRRAYREHPQWGPVVDRAREKADALLRRVRDDGPFRSVELEGDARATWWGGKESKVIAQALWRTGELAIRERRRFQRVYDLPERVIPDAVRSREVSDHDALRELILLALDGHGWATAKTLGATWRLRPTRRVFGAALDSLRDEGAVVPCDLLDGDERIPGCIRPRDLEQAERFRNIRPRKDKGVLLTPFDPLLWDRERVKRLFGFDLVLEIYVPAARRKYGYYCMPVLAGERLVARVDLKADRATDRLIVRACHHETADPPSASRQAVRVAVERHARAVGLETIDWSAGP